MDMSSIEIRAAEVLRGLDHQLESKRLLTEIQVSQLTGRSRSALQKDRFFRKGIPFVKLGRSVRYHLGDVLAFIDGCRVKTDIV